MVHDHSVVKSGQRGNFFLLVEKLEVLHLVEPFVADLPGEARDCRSPLAENVAKLLGETKGGRLLVVVQSMSGQAELEVVVVG